MLRARRDDEPNLICKCPGEIGPGSISSIYSLRLVITIRCLEIRWRLENVTWLEIETRDPQNEKVINFYYIVQYGTEDDIQKYIKLEFFRKSVFGSTAHIDQNH